MQLHSKQIGALYVRNIVFGIEDGLVSTVGLISGIAAAGVPRGTIFLTGMVLIFVEAFSMAAGSLLSEHSAEEYIKHGEVPLRRSASGSVIMFFSYFISGCIPLAPYVFADTGSAFWLSMILSLVALAGLGVVSAFLFGIHVFRHVAEMVVSGGAAIAVGVGVGKVVEPFLKG